MPLIGLLSLVALSAGSTADSPTLAELRQIGTKQYEMHLSALGRSVAGLGDVDGDGIPDFVLGDPATPAFYTWTRPEDNGRGMVDLERGSAWVVSGRDFSVLLCWRGRQEGCRFGQAVAAAGDVDGDGRSDILVGAPGGADVAGEVRILSGRDGSELACLASGRTGDGFGSSLRAGRDEEGRAVVAVGAPADDRVGSVWLFIGPEWSGRRLATGSVENGRFGHSVDLLAAGESEGLLVVVGAPGADAVVGAAYLLAARTGEVRSLWPDPMPASGFGACVRVIDGIDGKPAIAVGAPTYGKQGDDLGDGAVFLFVPGRKAPMRSFTQQRSSLVDSDPYRCREESHYGQAIADAGDLDGDSVHDLLIGAPNGFFCGGMVGWAEVISGKTGESLRFLFWQPMEEEDWTPFEFATSLDVIGDLDRDGVADYLIGVPDPAIHQGGFQVVSGATGATLHWKSGKSFSERFGAELYRSKRKK